MASALWMASFRGAMLAVMLLHAAGAARIQTGQMLLENSSLTKVLDSVDGANSSILAPREGLSMHPPLPSHDVECIQNRSNNCSQPLSLMQADVKMIVSAAWEEASAAGNLVSMAVALLGMTLLCSCCFCCLTAGAGKSSAGRKQFISKGRVVYEWNQTDAKVNVYTKLPRGLKEQDIEVLVWPLHVQIGKKGKPPFLKEELYERIEVQSSAWTTSSTGELEVSLQKVRAAKWPCVMKAHLPKSKNSTSSASLGQSGASLRSEDVRSSRKVASPPSSGDEVHEGQH